MRKLIIALFIALLGTSMSWAQWESIDTWGMDDNGLYQTSDKNTNLGGHYATNNQQVAQISDDGLFRFNPVDASGYGAKIDLSSTNNLADGNVRIAWTYDALDFSAVNTNGTKHGFRLMNAAGTKWIGLSIEDVGNSDKIFAYAKDSEGVLGNNSKGGRLVNGLGPDTENRTFYMELDYENDQILLYSAEWQWTPSEATTFSFPYDFDANGITDIAKVQTWYQNWSTNDYIQQDEIAIENKLPEAGVFIADSASYSSANVAETNSAVASFAVTNGDWIVVESSVNKATWTEDSLTFSGTAAPAALSYQVNNGSGPNTYLWYAPVNAEGTIDITLNVAESDKAFGAIGAYVVRSTTGDADILDIAFAGSVSNAGPSIAFSYTNAYDLGVVADGLLIEAFSAYADGMSIDNGDYVPLVNQGGFKRVVGSAFFSGVDSVTNIYSTTVSNRQASVLGIAFTTGLSPESKYMSWVQDYPGVGAEDGLMDDPDGDLLDNLGEYAFNGNPDNDADRGNFPIESVVDDGGTSYLQYVHYEWSDKLTRGLEYVLEVNTEGLSFGSWSQTGIEFMGSAPVEGLTGFSAVTNRIEADGANKFLRLQIEFTP